MRHKFEENDILAILRFAIAHRDRYLVRLIWSCMSGLTFAVYTILRRRGCEFPDRRL